MKASILKGWAAGPNFQMRSLAVLKSLGSTNLEWPMWKEKLRTSKDSEWPGGCGELSGAVSGSVRKSRFGPPLNDKTARKT